ncbi:DMT family transporter [Anaerotignum sp.]|uniref:DMT family transporter n=1 Tax=Anaerotignum sp. TaxID=2039241 RepID=UPI00332F984B
MNQRHKGIVCIIMSSFSFALMNLFVRLSGDLPSIQKSFFRNLVAMLFALLILLKEKPNVSLDRQSKRYLLYRSLFGTLGILCNFYAVDHLVLSDASLLNKMSPFFAVLFGILILKEKINLFQFTSIITAFIGVLFVVRPTGLSMDLFPALIGLLGGICAGAAYTYVRAMGQRGVQGPFIVFFFSAFSCLVTLPYLIFHYHSMNINQTIILLLAGLSAAGGQFGITAAYCYAPAREISVFDYSQIPFSALLGYFVFGQVPDVFSWIGYLIISCTAIAMFLYTNGYFHRKNILHSKP